MTAVVSIFEELCKTDMGMVCLISIGEAEGMGLVETFVKGERSSFAGVVKTVLSNNLVDLLEPILSG